MRQLLNIIFLVFFSIVTNPLFLPLQTRVFFQAAACRGLRRLPPAPQTFKA